MEGQWAWREIPQNEWDFIAATLSFTMDLEPGDLDTHEIATLEEFFGVDMSDLMTFPRRWVQGMPA